MTRSMWCRPPGSFLRPPHPRSAPEVGDPSKCPPWDASAPGDVGATPPRRLHVSRRRKAPRRPARRCCDRSEAIEWKHAIGDRGQNFNGLMWFGTNNHLVFFFLNQQHHVQSIGPSENRSSNATARSLSMIPLSPHKNTHTNRG